MLNSIYVTIPIGVLLGFLSGLGTGGGSLLILWLTLVLDVAHSDARAINLMFFIPAALIACIFHWRQGKLDFKKVLPGIISGCLAASLCSFFFTGQTPELLKKAFGILLLYTGIREVMYKKKS